MIRLVQLLCPARHCVLGMAYQSTETTDREALEMLKDVFEKSLMSLRVNN